ncbi:hypothetical protein NE061598_08930 [Francisella tularensis subsp. tularensis NE061598]|nr:hypothetical protein NE061598_08930 [Francisella tularensis subsp. tularensis NE061598]
MILVIPIFFQDISIPNLHNSLLIRISCFGAMIATVYLSQKALEYLDFKYFTIIS